MKLRSLLLLSVIGICVNAAAQDKHFIYEPQVVKPGQTVQIIYDPAGTPLAGKVHVHGMVYFYNNYHWQVADVPLEAAGNVYKASVNIDKKCGLAAFKFNADGAVDNNNDQGYAIMTADPDHPGINAAGAYAGWGLLRSQNRGYGIPGYYNDLAISDTAFYYWLNNEVRWHPQESSQVLAVPFAKAVYAYQKESGLPRINRIIAYLTKTGGEANLLRVRQIYLEVLKRKDSADSLDKVLEAAYPNGSLARLKAYRNFAAARKPEEIEALASAFLKSFPQTTDTQFDQNNRISYAAAYQAVIILSAMKEDYRPLKVYLDQLDAAVLINLYYKLIEIPHNRKDIPDTKLLPYANMLVGRLEAIQNVPTAESWYLSPAQWHEQYEQYVETSVLPVHINLLRATGNYDAALGYAERAERYYRYKKASVNDDYAWLLNHAKKYDKLNDVLVKSIFENQSSPEMIELLKTDYVRHNGSDAGFDKYLNTLKNPALEAKSRDEIKKIMRNDDVPAWTMLGLDDSTVKFSELRGKTVVLDFWATWCVPCKASFPGMKLALERYKNDPSVVFYFVDTEERSDSYKNEVARYIKDHNYPFHILFDNKAMGAKQNDQVFASICKAYQTSGIPMKLIIAPDGKLRFLTDGYKGSATALADEISDMIELARK